MLENTFKYLTSKPWLPTIPVGSKKWWLLIKIKLTWEKNTVFHCREWRNDSLFILFIGLFQIIAESDLWSAKPFYWMYGEIVRRRVLCEFLNLGILSSTAKGTKWAHQPDLAVMGFSSAVRHVSSISSMKFLNKILTYTHSNLYMLSFIE